jgi:hypothetical protein
MYFNCENFMTCYLQIQHAISHKKIDEDINIWFDGCCRGLVDVDMSYSG